MSSRNSITSTENFAGTRNMYIGSQTPPYQTIRIQMPAHYCVDLPMLTVALLKTSGCDHNQIQINKFVQGVWTHTKWAHLEHKFYRGIKNRKPLKRQNCILYTNLSKQRFEKILNKVRVPLLVHWPWLYF